MDAVLSEVDVWELAELAEGPSAATSRAETSARSRVQNGRSRSPAHIAKALYSGSVQGATLAMAALRSPAKS